MSNLCSILGTFIATSSGNNLTLCPESVVMVTTFMLFGLQRWCETYPKKKPPNPNPDMMMPEARPFLPGRCVHAANKVDEYINPLEIPSPIPNSRMKPFGLVRNEQTMTVVTKIIPPTVSTLPELIERNLRFRVESRTQLHADGKDTSRNHHDQRLCIVELFHVNIVAQHFEVACNVG